MAAKSVELAGKEGSQIEKAKEPESPTNTPQDNKKPSLVSRASDWARHNHGPVVAVATCLLFAIGAIQAGIFIKQLDVIRKDQRPWIKVEMIGSRGMAFTEETPALKPGIKLTNTGKTPSKSISAQVFIEEVKNGEVPQFNAPIFHTLDIGAMFPNSPEEIAPDGNWQYYLSDAAYQKFYLSKTIFFVFYSTVTYKDVFGRDHWTKYCVVIYPGSVSVPYKSLECTKYNDTDNN